MPKVIYIAFLTIAFASCTPESTPPSQNSSAGIQVVNPSDTAATNPFFDLIDVGDIAELDTLYDQGHSIDSLDEEGFTLLHRAVMEQSERIVEWLLRHGVDPSGSPSAHEAPLSLVIGRAKLVPAQAIDVSNIFAIMRMLIEAGADPMAHYNSHPSAIQHAMDIQCEPCISFMKRASLSHAADLAK